MVVRIFCSPTDYDLEATDFDSTDVLIGVDYGAYYALQAGLTLDLALGDFDSTTTEETAYVKAHAKKIMVFSSIKDATDTALAVKEALKMNADEIIVYGGIGSRFDHSYANMLLLKLGPITVVTKQNEMFMLDPGVYTIENNFPYISFFAIEPVKNLTLSQFDYPVENYDLSIDDPLGVSNGGAGTIRFDAGLLLVIKSRD